jgi:hypothetical protein
VSAIRLLWTPYPFEAGFTITDDTGGANFESIKTVYDYLRQVGLVTTKTVWAFPAIDGCGIPNLPRSILDGVSLQDPSYLHYCKDLNCCGFEICLHGASSGNNKRDQIVRAFDLMNTFFRGEGTYICHAKCADNPYWEENVVPHGMPHALLKLFSRHTCCGELPGSEYFWGDICLQHVKQVRLFLTRSLNTLSVNPSMPYFDPAKPFVRGWFSATRATFMDCTTDRALGALKRKNGCTVLCQHLHRYADSATKAPLPAFRDGAERLAAEKSIWVASTAAVMSRLRAIQGLYLVYRKNQCWLCNVGDIPVKGVQLRLPLGQNISTDHDSNLAQMGYIALIRTIDPGKCVRVPFLRPIRAEGPRTLRLDGSKRALVPMPFGTVFINLTNNRWDDRKEVVAPWSCLARFAPQFAAIKPLSHNGSSENRRLVFGHLSAIASESFGGRRAGDHGADNRYAQ